MYIHQDGRYYPYDWNSVENSNQWQQQINSTNEAQNESMPNFTNNTTSFSLHPKTDEELNSYELSFIQVNENLWRANPQPTQNVNRNEEPSHDETFDEESLRLLQPQMLQGINLTNQDFIQDRNGSIQYRNGIYNDQSMATLEKQAIDITSNEDILTQSTPNPLPMYSCRESFSNATFNNIQREDVSNLLIKLQSNDMTPYRRLNGHSITPHRSSFSPQSLPIFRPENVELFAPQSSSSSQQESDLNHSITPNRSSFSPQSLTTCRAENVELCAPQSSSCSQQESNLNPQKQKSLICTEIISSPTQENEEVNNEQGIPSLDQETILLPTKQRISFPLRERNSSHSLQSEPLFENDIENLEDLQLVASTKLIVIEGCSNEIRPSLFSPKQTSSRPSIQLDTLKSLDLNHDTSDDQNNKKRICSNEIRPSLFSPKKTSLRPSIQLDTLKSLDLNHDISDDLHDKKCSMSTSLLKPKSQETNNENQPKSPSRLQELSPTAFHYYKQNVHTMPLPKWIQKLIIIPAQCYGCHDITCVVLRHLEKEMPYFKCGQAQLFLQQTSGSLAIYDKKDGNYKFKVFDDFGRFFKKIVFEEKDASCTPDPKEFDTMLAQLKSSLFGCSLTIPITCGKFNLGLQQIICLIEHQQFGTAYCIVATLNGEGCH